MREGERGESISFDFVNNFVKVLQAPFFFFDENIVRGRRILKHADSMSSRRFEGWKVGK